MALISYGSNFLGVSLYLLAFMHGLLLVVGGGHRPATPPRLNQLDKGESAEDAKHRSVSHLLGQMDLFPILTPLHLVEHLMQYV